MFSFAPLEGDAPADILAAKSYAFHPSKPKNVSVGYINFHTEDINVEFKQESTKDSNIWTWTANNTNAYQGEDDSEEALYYTPHIIVYIKNYDYKGKNYKVHRLVCEAFNGPPPFDKAIVMHLNDDATNNRPENLAWGTHKENLNTPSFIAYCKSRTAENNPRVKGRRRKAEALAQESMR